MSLLIDRYRIIVSLFFWLRFPEETLRRILGDAGFPLMATPLTPLPSIQVAPGVRLTVGGLKQISSFKSVKIGYDDVKFMLNFEGVVNDVVEALKRVEPSFRKFGYPLEDVCHYFEVTFPPQPIDVDGFVQALRRSVRVNLDIHGEKLAPFSISFSNFEEPISKDHFYTWFHVSLEPDVNAPGKRLLLRIIKRDTSLNKVIAFLEGLEQLIDRVKAFASTLRPGG